VYCVTSQHQSEFSSVMVILCDYKLRKFQRRLPEPDEVTVPKMSQIEEALSQSKTKLNAALARSRIKSRVLSIDWLLPDSVRKNDKIGNRMHVTCWVNFVKTRSVCLSVCLSRRGHDKYLMLLFCRKQHNILNRYWASQVGLKSVRELLVFELRFTHGPKDYLLIPRSGLNHRSLLGSGIESRGTRPSQGTTSLQTSLRQERKLDLL